MDRAPYFQGEDQPIYTHARVYFYHASTSGEFILYQKDSQPLSASIQERESSIMFTIARLILSETCQYLPMEQPRYMSPFNGYSLYGNPLVDRIIKTLNEDDRVVIDIKGDTWTVFYPVTQEIDIARVNIRLGVFAKSPF